MNRVSFLVDGFNLYHSTVDLDRTLGLRVKWLNIYSLCSSFLYLIGRDAAMAEVYYFSAYAYQRTDAGAVTRHKDYVKCLESTGIVPEIARFKPKDVRCPLGGTFTKYEEKETDIAIASKLFEIMSKDKCDVAILVTGDTDLAPSVETCKRLFPAKAMRFAFPYRRHSHELETLLPDSFKIHRGSYTRHLFPDPVALSDGTRIHKPTSW